MPDPLFNIVIPTYDRPELLVTAIASVLAQTVLDFEVLVDDGSPAPVRYEGDARVRVVRRSGNGARPRRATPDCNTPAAATSPSWTTMTCTRPTVWLSLWRDWRGRR